MNARNEGFDADKGRNEARPGRPRFAVNPVDDDVENIFASLSYLLDKKEIQSLTHRPMSHKEISSAGPEEHGPLAPEDNLNEPEACAACPATAPTVVVADQHSMEIASPLHLEVLAEDCLTRRTILQLESCAVGTPLLAARTLVATSVSPGMRPGQAVTPVVEATQVSPMPLLVPPPMPVLLPVANAITMAVTTPMSVSRATQRPHAGMPRARAWRDTPLAGIPLVGAFLAAFVLSRSLLSLSTALTPEPVLTPATLPAAAAESRPLHRPARATGSEISTLEVASQPTYGPPASSAPRFIVGRPKLRPSARATAPEPPRVAPREDEEPQPATALPAPSPPEPAVFAAVKPVISLTGPVLAAEP